MFAEQRQERIMRMLEEYNQVDVNSLTAILQASEATIRRDLEKLERGGFLRRTHGGAILAEKSGPAAITAQKNDSSEAVFESIGKSAARIISAREVIAIGAGPFGMALAKALDSGLQCSVITNDARIMIELLSRGQQHVIMVGGLARKTDTAMFTSGDVSIQMLDEFNVSKAFLGVDGIDHDAGLTAKDFEQASIWKKLMGISKETVIMALPEAFGRRELVRLAPIKAAGRFVTCGDADAVYKKYFFENGIPFHFGFDL